MTLVPEQFSYEFDLKLYKTLGVALYNRIETQSFRSIAREVLGRYGTAGGYADETTKSALLYQAILYTKQNHLLEYFDKQLHQSSFLQEVQVLFETFRKNGITVEKLSEIGGDLSGALRGKVSDLFQIYSCYDRLLQERGLVDTETMLSEAAGVASAHNAYFGCAIFLDEFEILTEEEYEMFDALLGTCQDMYIALRTENVEERSSFLFESVNRTYHRIRQLAADLHIEVSVEKDAFKSPCRFFSDDLTWLSKSIFRPGKQSNIPMEHIHLLEADSPGQEVDFVCTTIRRMLSADPSLRCRDIVLLSGQLHEYQSTIETAMQRYDLPYHIDEPRSVQYFPLFIYLYALTDLVRSTSPDTELLLRLGKTGLTPCTKEEIADLENYCYYWQIDGETWTSPFLGKGCERVEPIRKKFIEPFLALQKDFKKAQTGGDFCRVLYHFAEKQKIQNLLDAQLQELTAKESETDRIQLTEDWIFVWNSWIGILDSLVGLYANVPMESHDFCMIFTSLLRNVRRALPPMTLDAVLVTRGGKARLASPKIVFLLGANEGIFPEQPIANPIFSERDCAKLEKCNVLVANSKETQIIDARFAAYVQLSAPSQELFLSYSLTDTSQKKMQPSEVVRQICQMFPNGSVKRCADYGSAYYATTLPAAYYQYVQNYTLQDIDTKSIEKVLYADDFYAKKLENLKRIFLEQRSVSFHIFDKSLLKLRYPGGIHLSASSLEQYQKCPFSYFCQYMMRLQVREKMQLSGVENGSMVHECLERILKENSLEEFLSMGKEELQENARAYAEHYWQEEMGGDFSKSQREKSAYHHAVQDITKVLNHVQGEMGQSDFVPKYLELQISSDSVEFPPMELETEQGEKILYTGRIDRVDLCQDGDKLWVRVVDYKTGTKMFSLGNLLYGLDMQMLLYLFTITSPQAALSGAQPAGVLYMPSGHVRSDVSRESEEDPAVHAMDQFRMNGVLLHDPTVLKHMEHSGEGHYIAARVSTNHEIDEKSGIFLTADSIERLRDFVIETLRGAAGGILNGEIDASPLGKKNESPCQWCNYQNVCGHTTGRPRRLQGDKKSTDKEMRKRLATKQDAEK